MENNKREHNLGALSSTAKESYEAKVGLEALKRAGKNKNLHGIVHEILVKDSINSNPKNIISGTRAVLSNSTTAVRDDILLKQGGKIVGRMQLKDTSKSIGKTIKQVAEGHYKGTVLVGTKETTKAFGDKIAKNIVQGTKITQKMSSSGISSADTTRIAAKTLGSNISKDMITSAVKSSGGMGAIMSGGFEVLSSGKEFVDGKISGEEFAGKVVKETISGGASSAAATATATVITAAATTALAEVTAPVWIPAAIGVGTAIAVGSAVKGVFDFIFD